MDLHYTVNGKTSSVFQEIDKEVEKARLQAYSAAAKFGQHMAQPSSRPRIPEECKSIEPYHSTDNYREYDKSTNTVNKNELKQILIGDKLAYIKVSSEWRKVNFGTTSPDRRFLSYSNSNMSLDEFVVKMNSKIMSNGPYFTSLTRDQAVEIQKVRQLSYPNNDSNFLKDEDLNIDELIESFVDPDCLKKRLQSMLRKEFANLHELPVSIRELMWYADSQNAAIADVNDMEQKFNQMTSHLSSEDDVFYLFDKRTEAIAHSIQVASRHLYATNEHLIRCKAGHVPSSLSFRILIVIFKLIWTKFTMEKVIDLIIIQKLYFYIKSLYHTLDLSCRLKITSILKKRDYLSNFLECFGYDFLLCDTTPQDITAINYLRCICYLHGSRSVSSITKEITEDIAVGKYFENYASKVNNYRHRRMTYTRSFCTN